MKNQIVNGNTLFSILAAALMVFAVQGVTFAQEEPEAPDLIVVERANIYPEGIEYDPENARFLIGSLSEGTIFEVFDDGTHGAFIEDEALMSTVGIEVDADRNRLLVAETNVAAFGDPTAEPRASLGVYDLTTGERLDLVDLLAATPEGAHFANDVAVDAEGNAYVTDTLGELVYQVDLAGEVSVFVESESFGDADVLPNGIVFHPDGYLLVSDFGNGFIFKAPLDSSSAVTQVEMDEPIPGADSMVLHPNGNLIVVGNAAQTVFSLHSDDDWASATIEGVSPDHPATTAAIRGESVYAVYAHLGEFFAGEPVEAFEIVRVEFEPGHEPGEVIAQGYAVLNVEQEIPAPAVDTHPAGTAALRLDAEDNLHFSITVTGLSGPITGAHFHGPAPEGENAGVIFPFITEPFEEGHIEGVWEGLNDEGLDYLFEGLLYLNIHTAANPPGEIRGQVHMGENGVAFLSGDAQVHDVETDGAGTGAFKLIDDGTALWFNITVTGLSGPITGAHFHGPAGEGENAGVIFPFITEPFDGEHVEGIWPDLTDEALEYLLHEGIYVNVHTAANPPGEIRGQVVGLELPLEGEEENFFTIDLDPGLNMISLPLRPPEPYTARTLAEQLDATVVIKLDSARQQFVGFTPDTDSDGFPIEGGKGYIVNVPDGGTATFTGRAWTNNAPPGVPVVNLRTTA